MRTLNPILPLIGQAAGRFGPRFHEIGLVPYLIIKLGEFMFQNGVKKEISRKKSLVHMSH